MDELNTKERRCKVNLTNDKNKEGRSDNGWIIVAASFCNAFIFDGIGSGFGVLYPYVLDKFGSTAFLTSFSGSIFGAYLIMGTVASLLIKRTSFRFVCFLGGLLASVALFLSAFCTNIYLFLAAFGIFGGCSVGLVFLPSMVIVNYYFDKKRGLANGIVTSGSGVGLFVMAPIINHLLHKYGLDGTLIVLSGIILHCCVFSMFYNGRTSVIGNVSATISALNDNHGDDDNEKLVECRKDSIGDSVIAICNFNKHYIDNDNDDTINNTNGDNNSNNDNSNISNDNSNNSNDNSNNSDYYNNDVNTINVDNDSEINDELAYDGDTFSGDTISFTSGDSNNRHFDKASEGLLQQTKPDNDDDLMFHEKTDQHGDHDISLHNGYDLKSYSDKYDDKYTDSNTRIKYTADMSVMDNDLDNGNSMNIVTNKSDCSQGSNYRISELVRKMPFLLICSSACFVQMGYNVPSMFLADLALEHGVSSYYSAYIIGAIGASNTIGRVFSGWLAYLGHDPGRLMDTALLLASILCFLSPLYTNVWTLGTFAVCYGFLVGFVPPLQPLVIVKYFGIGSLGTAFGLMSTLKGVANIVGPPLAGMVYDMSNDYSMSIIYTGVVILLSAIVGELVIVCSERPKKTPNVNDNK